MKTISIVYCKPCGYLPRANDAAEAVRRELGFDVTLVPGTGGIFEVKVGEEVVAKRVMGRFPDADEIVAAVAKAVRA